ncbi:hypothetical protein [Burkholderia plantarii]|uniref:hypothetical protein n=1 Tax=Burkholderia plantarii TaxID=41899 RepID=UPI0008709A0A|nr:hypothetical protein [Burkholderia plantarii]
MNRGNGKKNGSGVAASSSVLSPQQPHEPPPPRDLVTATLAISAPQSTLTGGRDSLETTGKNTGWTKGPGADAAVPRYGSRKAYLEQNQAGHPFARHFANRHVQADEAEDKRGLSCAEGHSVLESHQRLSSEGKTYGLEHLEALKQAMVPMPKFSANTSSTHKRKMLNKRDEALGAILASTGMDSWEQYVGRESSYLAWNDIQQHARFSRVRHDPASDIKPGQDMDYCTRCRTEIADQLKNES